MATKLADIERMAERVKDYSEAIWGKPQKEVQHVGRARFSCIAINFGGNGVILNIAVGEDYPSIHDHPMVEKLTDLTGVYSGHYSPVRGDLFMIGTKKWFVFEGKVYQVFE